MTTNVEEFRLFNKLLTKGRTDYVPYFFVLRPGGKEPLGERGPWKEARVTFEEACDWMKAGYNIGIAGTDGDPLVIIDIDKEGVVDDIKPTLCIRTRKRTGRHHFYFTSDPRCKVNVPTAENVGEIRSSWQYVVCCGSFVRTDPAKLEVQPPEDQLPSLGSYTIEKDAPVATITFDELPLIFRQTIVDQAAPQPPKREPKKWDKEGPQSKIWSVTLKDVIGDYPEGRNFPSPFHGSEGGINTTVSNGLLHCWRHKVSLTPLQALVVKAGIMDCMTAGDGHKGSSVGPSTIDFKNKEFVVKLWEYAKKNGIVPEDDVHPFGEDQPRKKHGGKGEKKPDLKRRQLPTKVSDEAWKQIVEELTVGKDEEVECPTVVAKPFYYFADGSVAREILDGKVPRFALFNPDTDEIVIVDHVKGDLGEIVIPVWDGFIGPRLGVTLPEKPEDYGDAVKLFKDIEDFFLKYYDPVDVEGLAHMRLCILYCMLTGFQDQNIDYWPIVNHRGASETGKGRLAFEMYLVCDRGMWQVHPSIGTLHRDVNTWRPTLVIDEADMEKTDASNDMIQFYNARATGAVFSRYNTDAKGSEVTEVTGPTVLCTRQGFKDDGMESRCLIITGKQGRNMGRNKEGKEGVPYAMPPKAFDEARKIRNKLLTFWFKNHNKYEVDYYGSFDGPITPRFQTTTLELMGMAEKIGLKDIVLATTTEMSKHVVDQRAETTEGRVVRALHSLWTDPDVGHKVPSESSKYLSAEGYFGLVALKRGENGREENVVEVDVSAKELAEIGHRDFGLHAYKETDKPMAASAIGKQLANLGIKTDQKKVGGHVRHLILLKAVDLEYLCRKFVPGYEMGHVSDGRVAVSVFDDFDKKKECASDGMSSPQSNYSPEKVAGVAGVAGGIGRDTPPISGPDERAGNADNDDFSKRPPLCPATPATEKESGGVTPPIRPATVATPATATPATEGGKHSNATERQTSSNPTNGKLDVLMEEARKEANKRLEDLQRRACPNEYEYEVNGLQAAINRVVQIKKDGGRPGVHELYNDVPKLFPGFEAEVKIILETFGSEIVALGIDLYRLKEAPR